MQTGSSLQISTEYHQDLPELFSLCDADLDPLFWQATRQISMSAWWGHVPFAFWLMSVLRPRLVVELGTHSGVSYSAFCEAVIRERLDTRCFAVDTWQGDEHAGFYDESVYWDFRTFHDERYGAFSGTLRSTFDSAVSKFNDRSIDLLHIDGLHTREAVKHDFETWAPKLSERCVLLIHDTNEREGDFGVWRFWAEISEQMPSFEFLHGHGLGMASVGNEVCSAVAALCSVANPSARARIRERFAFAGERWIANMRERQTHRELGERDVRILALERSLQDLEQRTESDGLAQIEHDHAMADAERNRAEAEAASRLEAEASRLEAERERAEEEIRREREKAASAQRQVRAEADARIELKEKSDKTNLRLRQERDAARGEAAQLRREIEAEAARRFVSESVRRQADDAARAQSDVAPLSPAAQVWSERARSDVRRYAKLISLILTLHPQEFRAEREIKRSAGTIRSSPLFNGAWYKERYQDVAGSGLDPVVHYVKYGAAEGRNPSSAFDATWYLQKYPDVAAAGANPLLHYLVFGAAEGREIRAVDFEAAIDPGIRESFRQLQMLTDSPLFDVDWYLEQNPDVAAAGLNPLLHYLSTGAAEGRNPGPSFDGNSYLQRYPEIAAAGLNPLLHYIEWGQNEGREPRPVVLSRDGKPLITNVDQIAEARYPALKPIPVYLIPKGSRRLTVVTDSINSGWLFGGVGTALIFSALLAQRIGSDLRLLTRMQPPELNNLKDVLAANGITWDGNIERACLSGAKKRDVTISDQDVFLTTSWWTTRSVAGAVDKQRIIYLLQEDERMFYPFGDERLRCQETLADPDLRFVVNSELLFRHLTTGPDALDNIRQSGMYFEPAFPSSQYFPESTSGEPGSKSSLFFYARPENLRNLYWRGLEALSASVAEGVLTPENWDFYFVGRSIGDVVLPGNIRPKILENLSWAQYGELVRRMDLGLSLMDTPHPSYPPLDLAASGAVVVTNRHGVKTSLTRYSRNILCSDATVEGLKNALREGARLAEDRPTRFRNYTNNQLSRNWASALEPVVESAAESILKGGK